MSQGHGRIVEIEHATVSVPLERPLQAGSLRIELREYLCVRVTLDSGTAGECFVLTRGLDVGAALADLFAEAAIGGGPERLEALRSLVRNVGWDGPISRAASALRLAFLDARARERGEPVWRTVGGEHAPSSKAVVVIGYTRAGDDPGDADIDDAAAAVEAGARCLKLMAGAAGPTVELRRLAAVRDAVGDEIELGLDVNGAWAVAEAHAALPRLADLGVFVVEEPWAYEHGLSSFDGLPAERPPLAFGEVSSSILELEAIANSGLVEYIRGDATLLGGAEAYRELAPALAASRCVLFPHFWPELHSHLVAPAPAGYLLECVLPESDEFGLARLISAPTALTAAGELVASSGPGFGFALDWEWINHQAERPPTRSPSERSD